MRTRLIVAAFLPALFGCYLNRPLLGPPVPSSRVAVMLTDVGRAEEASRVGPGALRIEGSLVEATDTALVLSVSGVQPIRGGFVRWAGETVSVKRSHVAQSYERRLSPGRTALAAGGAAGILVAVILGSDLFGFGGQDIPIIPPPIDPPVSRKSDLTSNQLR